MDYERDITRERIEGKRDWKGSWAIDGKERRPGVKSLKESHLQRVGKKNRSSRRSF